MISAEIRCMTDAYMSKHIVVVGKNWKKLDESRCKLLSQKIAPLQCSPLICSKDDPIYV